LIVWGIEGIIMVEGTLGSVYLKNASYLKILSVQIRTSVTFEG